MGSDLWIAAGAAGRGGGAEHLGCAGHLWSTLSGILWGSGSSARGTRKHFHFSQTKWSGSGAETSAHTSRIWLLDFNRNFALVRMGTQTEKALKPPKKENCDIQLLQLLPLISSSLTDIDFSTRAPCPAFINIMPRYHIHSCMPARFLIPQVCCCRPCVLLKYFLVAQRQLVFNSKCSIHSSFFP